MKRTKAMKTTVAALAIAVGASLTVQPADADGRFTYWSMWNENEPQQIVIQSAIEQFTSDTGIEVDVQWVGRDIAKKLAPTLNAAVTPMDLVDGPQRKIYSALVSTGSHHDLASLYARNVPGEGQTVEEVLIPNVRDVVTTDGVTWMVPYTMFSASWWYDGGAMPELAGNEPASWDGLVALFDNRKQQGRQVIAQDGDIGFYNLYFFTEIAVRHLGPNNLNAAIEDRSGEALKHPGILRTAEQIEELVSSGFFASGYDASKWPAQQQAWAAGEMDFIYMGTWLPKETASFMGEGFQPRSFQMPAVSDDSVHTNEVAYIGYSIPARAENIGAAEQFIAYFMKKENLARLAEVAEVIVPRPGIEIAEHLKPLYDDLNSGGLSHAAYDGINSYNADYTRKVLTPLVNELIFGQIGASEFHDQLVEQTVRYWDLHG